MIWLRNLFEKGHIKEWAADGLGIAGVSIIWSTAYLFEKWEGFWFWLLMCIGAVLGYAAAYGGLAKQFGFQPPFTNDPLGWRKAKETYKTEEEAAKPPPHGLFARLGRWLKK